MSNSLGDQVGFRKKRTMSNDLWTKLFSFKIFKTC